MRLKFFALLLAVSMFLASCSTAVVKPGTSSEPSKPAKSGQPKTEAEKQAEEHEKIAQEALDNEHEHTWVFDGFGERHPHSAEYKCDCGATRIVAHETAAFEMKNVGVSKEHPHFVLQECSICKIQIANENMPTTLEWVLDGYTEEHPHYGKVKCTQCDYYEINNAITSEGMGVSKLVVDGYTEEHPHHPIIKCTYKGCDHTYVEYNSTSVDTGASKLIVEGYTKDHPHYPIVKCTFEGCDHSYVEKNSMAEWELETDSDNYEAAHPHFLHGTCSHEGCSHTERTNMIADWDWKDGVCSICGHAKDVLYTDAGDGKMVTGTVETGFSGHLDIPAFISSKPVEVIGTEAFFENTLMTSVRIPDTVRIIEAHAFENCINMRLEPLEVCPYCRIEQGLRDEPECPLCGSFIEDQFSGHPIGNIGLHVEIIGDSAFRNCSSLEAVHFGEHIREILDFAFAGCMNLRRISFSATVAPVILPGTFEGLPPETKIFIPVDAVGYDTPEWEAIEIVRIDFPDQ